MFLQYFSYFSTVDTSGSELCTAMSLIFVLFLFLLTYIFFWLKNRQNFWKDRGFDYVKCEFPFGSFKGVGTEKSITIAMDEYYKQFKGKTKAVGLFLFVKPLLLVIDNELVKSILIQNFNSFHDRSLYYNKVSIVDFQNSKSIFLYYFFQEDDPISVHLLALRGRFREKNFLLYEILLKLKQFQAMNGAKDVRN